MWRHWNSPGRKLKSWTSSLRKTTYFHWHFSKGGPWISESPSLDFFRFWCVRCFNARRRRRRSVNSVYLVISEVFGLFNFLSCLYKEPLPKILVRRLVASLRRNRWNYLETSNFGKSGKSRQGSRTFKDPQQWLMQIYSCYCYENVSSKLEFRRLNEDNFWNARLLGNRILNSTHSITQWKIKM